MARRLQLQTILENDILESNNVYFQPPESVRLKYPCIVYNEMPGDQKRADDITYLFTNCYEVTVIDSNPDSTIGDRLMSAFSMCRFNRNFKSDNLYHKVYTIYY